LEVRLVPRNAEGWRAPSPSLSTGRFDAVQVATARGMFYEMADCYLLAYVSRVAE
jgi:hypothetical protein